MKTVFALFIWIFPFVIAEGQLNHFATPFITNYEDFEYGGGTQNWNICQHPNGVMLIANNDGLLEFDGTSWQLYRLGQNSVMRSVHVYKEKIFAGGQREFGFFTPNTSGLLNYTSLKPKIPIEFLDFADVWNIEEQGGRIYFNSSGRIYEYFNDSITVFDIEQLNMLEKVEDRIFVHDYSSLYEIKQGQLSQICETNGIQFTDIVSLGSGSNQYLLSTNKKGLFTLKNGLLSPLDQSKLINYNKYKVNSLERINDEIIAMSTIKEGLLILNNEAELLQIINKKTGLQNNNVISISVDRNKNIWLGLDHGIDFIAFNSPFYKILADGDQEGASYTAKIFKDYLYVGTSTGLYKTHFEQGSPSISKAGQFEYIQGAEGQVWGLDIVGDELFLSHNSGGYLVKNNKLEKVTSSSGVWKFLDFDVNSDQIILGKYEGLEILEKKGKEWLSKIKFTNWKESCRIIEKDKDGIIWVSHPYQGIYKVDVDTNLYEISYQLLGSKHQLPSDFNNHLFNLNDDIYFTGETGIYQYDRNNNNFIHNDFLEQLIGANQSVLRLILDDQENIWFVTKEEVGVLKKVGNKIEVAYEKVIFPELSSQLVAGFEYIYPYDSANVFIGAKKGMIHFNPSKYKSGLDEKQLINITKVQLITAHDSTIYSGSYTGNKIEHDLNLKRNENGFRFTYSSSDFEPFSKISYTTKLEGFDQNWSEWTSKTEKEYSNLSSGTYTFHVKSRNNHLIESPPENMSLTIMPAWYATAKYLILYFVLGLCLLLTLILFPAMKLTKVIKVKEKELAENEKEIMHLKNAQLESEIAFKNQELATKTMHLLSRRQLIDKLEKPLDNILRSTVDEQSKREILSVKKLLKEDAQMEDDWHQFSKHFDQVHNDFISKMRLQYPMLTSSDLKLCAFLKMDLSTKEIAPLLNISIRGVETGRYRLRRKLQINGRTDLRDFMNSV